MTYDSGGHDIPIGDGSEVDNQRRRMCDDSASVVQYRVQFYFSLQCGTIQGLSKHFGC